MAGQKNQTVFECFQAINQIVHRGQGGLANGTHNRIFI